MAVIEPVLSLFEVQIERVAGHPIELDQPALGIAPEALNAIDMRRVASKLIVAMVDTQVFVKAHIDQAVVAAPAIGVNDAGNVGSPRMIACSVRLVASGTISV